MRVMMVRIVVCRDCGGDGGVKGKHQNRSTDHRQSL
jgi:hypothetical protein